MHHSPVDEFAEGLAGGGTPWAHMKHDEGTMRLHNDQGDVPQPEYPNVHFKDAVEMVKDAVRGPRHVPAGGKVPPAAASEVPAPKIEPVAKKELSEYDKVLKKEADDAMKGGRPSPGIALE